MKRDVEEEVDDSRGGARAMVARCRREVGAGGGSAVT
jgi:hypothetical protein